MATTTVEFYPDRTDQNKMQKKVIATAAGTRGF
jgi:hypothetical protein